MSPVLTSSRPAGSPSTLSVFVWVENSGNWLIQWLSCRFRKSLSVRTFVYSSFIGLFTELWYQAASSGIVGPRLRSACSLVRRLKKPINWLESVSW